MAKTYNEYALLPLAQYNTFKPILEDDLSEVESKIVGVITQTNINQEEKISKLSAILSVGGPSLISESANFVEGKQEPVPNTTIPVEVNEGNQISDFSHLSNCFVKDNKNTNNSIQNQGNPQSSDIKPSVVQPSETPKPSVSLAQEVSAKRKPSILDSSQLLKKEQLLNEVKSDLKRNNSSDKDTKKTTTGDQEDSVRKSKRAKKSSGWKKYY